MCFACTSAANENEVMRLLGKLPRTERRNLRLLNSRRAVVKGRKSLYDEGTWRLPFDSECV